MSPRRLRALASSSLAVIVVACGAVNQPEPTPSSPISMPPQAAEIMVVGVHLPVERALGEGFGLTPSDLPLYSLHPNGSLWDSVVKRFVYSGVYRLDETSTPMPDLAEAPCAVSEDLLVITCALRDATFHDGSPLTADDVAFTYQLMISEACRLPLCVDPDWDRLVAATALDARTVEFRLAEPHPAFIAAYMTEVLIEPRALVEAAFADFVEASGGTDPASLEALTSRLMDALRPDGVSACEPPDEEVIAASELAIVEMGRGLRSREAYAIGPGGEFDACAYGDYLVRVLTDAADTLNLSGIDAIAAAYRILDPPSPPVGSGPWRVRSIDPGVSMELEGFDRYHHGSPAAERLEVRLLRSTAEAIETVRGGTVHWLLEPFTSGENLIAEGIGDAAGLVWAEYNRFGYFGLHYNLREGQLFADANLRAAIELCVDRDETVAAATGGNGVSIYSPYSPSTWAFEPDLQPPVRDIAAAKELIEASGWEMGDDGVYRMGDKRLTTSVPLRDTDQWIRFLELLAFQVAECGIEITLQPLSFDDLVAAIEWPLLPPGADRQWDAVFAAWITSPDPDSVFVIFHSSEIVTASNPLGWNYMGYDSPEADALLDEARATYDQPERARLYHQFQQRLAEDRPVLFAWSPRVREARNERLDSTQGPPATDTSTWWWQLETLFVRASDP